MKEQEDMPMREKYWSEIEVEEKISRMRQVIQGLSRRIEILEQTLAQLCTHSHAANGQMVIPFGYPHTYLSSSQEWRKKVDDDVWF